MKSILAFLAGWILCGAAAAGDVYVTTDAGGHRIYTDTPQAIPAQKLKIHSHSTGAGSCCQRVLRGDEALRPGR